MACFFVWLGSINLGTGEFLFNWRFYFTLSWCMMVVLDECRTAWYLLSAIYVYSLQFGIVRHLGWWPIQILPHTALALLLLPFALTSKGWHKRFASTADSFPHLLRGSDMLKLEGVFNLFTGLIQAWTRAKIRCLNLAWAWVNRPSHSQNALVMSFTRRLVGGEHNLVEKLWKMFSRLKVSWNWDDYRHHKIRQNKTRNPTSSGSEIGIMIMLLLWATTKVTWRKSLASTSSLIVTRKTFLLNFSNCVTFFVLAQAEILQAVFLLLCNC